MKKTAEQSVRVVVDITCDACGNSVIPSFHKASQASFDDFNEFGVLRASYGYGSSYDGDNFHYDLCEKCFDKLVDAVKALRVSNGLIRP